MPTSYTVTEIREALAAAKEQFGQTSNNPTATKSAAKSDIEFDELVQELARDSVREERTIYRISRDDLEIYLEMREDGPLCSHRAEGFITQAEQYIEDTEALGETIAVCMDLAHREARDIQCGCPPAGDDDDDEQDDSN